jgi:hypothetical protein
MARLTKDQLVTRDLPTDEVELPSGRGSVLVRGLTRTEAITVTKEAGEDPELLERHGMAIGMVDPVMTLADVAEWQGNGLAADVQAAAFRISELSNLDVRGGKGPTSRSRRTRS